MVDDPVGVDNHQCDVANCMTEPTLVPAPIRVYNRHCLYFIKLIASPEKPKMTQPP